MADGAWPGDSERGDDRTRRAIGDLREVLADLEGRLSGPAPAALRPEAADALVRALEALAIRIVRYEHDAADRHAELSALLRLLVDRLDAETRPWPGVGRPLAEHAPGAAPERPGDPGPIRAVLVAASALAALSVTGAGVLAFSHPEALSKAAAPLVGRANPPPRPRLVQPAGVEARGPGLALRDPQAATPPARESLASVQSALERGEATALARLTGLAQGGDIQAQLHLAGLYDAGAAGLPRDMAAARLWTRRAAEGGERIAMHNLGLFLANGEGGPRDPAEAAIWFRRAAESGVVDSQHNLGLVYEAGRGVERNLREAYRWFAIAANAGDAPSREKAIELEARLRPAERAGLDGEVAAFRPGAPRAAEAAGLIAPATTLAETQALLARQGYYLGPIDGLASPALGAATAAYRRDHPGARPPTP